MITGEPPLWLSGRTVYLPLSFSSRFTPFSVLLRFSIRLFFISIPAITFSLAGPWTALTTYHLGPRFIYERSSVISERGDVMRFLRSVSLWNTSLDAMSSLMTENWLYHVIRESFTYLYMTMSSGRSSKTHGSSAGVCHASCTYLSRMSSLFSMRLPTISAELSVYSLRMFPAIDRTSRISAIIEIPYGSFLCNRLWVFIF